MIAASLTDGSHGVANLFPKEFADLEPIARAWALDSYDHKKHLQSCMEEIEAFYDAVFPRAKEILAYCDGFDILNPPADVRAFLNVLGSLLAVSCCVEVWKQARLAARNRVQRMRCTGGPRRDTPDRR